MKLLLRMTITLGLLVSSPALLAADLNGLWKNDEQAIWINIQFDGDSATGTVARDDADPAAVGALILKEVVADSEAWHGQIYAKKLGAFKAAELTLTSSDQLTILVKMGLFSKSVGWTRVTALPAD
ncbi:MAG: DUF2147 domain-containing protein [Gammaproteobacteria bacterium]|jgi:hypothetical protein|nr:DUF2147 domain-containing protein [Gammaproteobacteria bacterium]MBT5223637.1 DUF2147 domain-containing protein [Gammaproteobacteria bacterium]MBT5825943.1 DUF2147 domain-containing protein [Gammaproteobacteria bacterium]MBT6419390.1 DUF2147 domain-containing protein [Gammaproteobacteria bacterium]MBT6576050.1 DUF2147 domain-containing protein [Gammaproteobacteria bacterium]